jgi:methyl-accepting chemotaxis protein
LEEITATVKRTAEGATHARTVVAAAKLDAETGGEVVGKAIVAMNAIETSSQGITQIIGVIDEIAFQTNLLALNAGVEAARAGDAGRGFAVVAQEVRALAQRSAEAAKEIKVLIATSTTQVSAGVDLVAQTGKALERIVNQVAQINGVVGEIAASAQEQSSGLQQVNVAINQMDQVTQQNAAMVEESTAASHALAREAQDLARLIGRFKVGGDGAQVQAGRQQSRPGRAA